HAVLGEPPRRVLGGVELADAAGRILQRRLYGMPAIEDGRTVTIEAMPAEARPSPLLAALRPLPSDGMSWVFRPLRSGMGHGGGLGWGLGSRGWPTGAGGQKHA